METKTQELKWKTLAEVEKYFKNSEVDFKTREIQWLELFVESLNEDVRKNLSVYKNRLLGPQRVTLEELLIKGKEGNALSIANWLNISVEEAKRRPILGGWKKEKTKGYISEIPEAYSDNG